jgi:uncharacterized protein (TIGR02453 family)
MDNTFFGFTAQSFQFFRDLAGNNHKPWFDRHRARYESHVVGAFRGLLATLEPHLLALNPNFETAGKTNRNFSRINRDIRFSKDKRPYKPNYYLYVFDKRRDREADGRMYVGLTADCLTVGFATYASWKRGVTSSLESIFRPRFASQRREFDDLLTHVVKGKRYETYWHRQEKGEWVQHPGLPRKDEDWSTLQAWIVRKVFLPTTRGIGTPAFAARIQQVFADLYPLYEFTSSDAGKKKPSARKSR